MVYEIETVIDYTDVEGCTDEDTEAQINSVNVKLINDRNKYDGVCFNYALNDTKCILKFCQEAYKELEREYEQINIKNARKGDVISYHEISDFKSKYEKPCNGNALHFAIIKETKGTLKSTIIKSKWGIHGVFETSLFDVPDMYGNAIVIWRKKGDYEIFNI